MKNSLQTSEGVRVLAGMTILFGLWNLYGSAVLLWMMETKPEFIGGFDQQFINGGKIYFRILAYVNPFLFGTLVLGSIAAFFTKRISLYAVVLCSIALFMTEVLSVIMDKEWLKDAFIAPHISPVIYVFNVGFLSWKLFRSR